MWIGLIFADSVLFAVHLRLSAQSGNYAFHHLRLRDRLPPRQAHGDGDREKGQQRAPEKRAAQPRSIGEVADDPDAQRPHDEIQEHENAVGHGAIVGELVLDPLLDRVRPFLDLEPARGPGEGVLLEDDAVVR